MGGLLATLATCFTLVEAWDIVSGRRQARKGRKSDDEIARLIAECRLVFPRITNIPNRSGAYQNGWLPPD